MSFISSRLQITCQHVNIYNAHLITCCNISAKKVNQEGGRRKHDICTSKTCNYFFVYLWKIILQNNLNSATTKFQIVNNHLRLDLSTSAPLPASLVGCGILLEMESVEGGGSFSRTARSSCTDQIAAWSRWKEIKEGICVLSCWRGQSYHVIEITKLSQSKTHISILSVLYLVQKYAFLNF